MQASLMFYCCNMRKKNIKINKIKDYIQINDISIIFSNNAKERQHNCSCIITKDSMWLTPNKNIYARVSFFENMVDGKVAFVNQIDLN